MLFRSVARSASIGSLGLQGCQIADLKGDGIKVNGGVFLRNGFAATGEVRLLGAEIGGDLDCSGGLFSNTDGDALNADRVKVTGSVFLRDGFAATDEVRLLGAEIGGSLYCTGGKFINADGKALSADGIRVTGDVFLREGFAATGEVRLLGAEIGGALDCSDGNFTNACRRAINGDGCRVINGLLLRGAHVTGAIDLAAASVGTLVDHGFDWHGGGHFLDGFAYDQLVGTTDGHQRIAWLRSQQKDQLDHRNFKPQPWEQLIAVLRAMGHPHEATKVAIAKQDQMRKAGKIGKPGSLWQWPENVFHILFRVLAGYGHRPAWTVVWLIGVWIVSSFAFYAGRDAGFFGPSSAVIEMSALHQACGAPGDRQPGSLDPRHPGHLLPGPPKAHWTSPACPLPPEYTTLQPALYSLDLILPVINLQQDGDWAPIVARSDGSPLFWGHALRGLVWFEILFGWITSLMLAAVVANLVRKD